MADAADSKSAGETRGSSNLPFGTKHDNEGVGSKNRFTYSIAKDRHASRGQVLTRLRLPSGRREEQARRRRHIGCTARMGEQSALLVDPEVLDRARVLICDIQEAP